MESFFIIQFSQKCGMFFLKSSRDVRRRKMHTLRLVAGMPQTGATHSGLKTKWGAMTILRPPLPLDNVRSGDQFEAMKNYLSLRYATLLATLLLAFGLVTRGQAQTGNLTTLDDAYATLAQADHDYKGHRVKAMKQIELAVQELGGRISGKGKGHEPQGTSDAQLRAAQGLLQQARAGLSGKALRHVNASIAQINDALAIR
jgi:hypothetical protein